MKKYAFGIAALVMAVAFSAFTSKPFATDTYYYVPTSGNTLIQASQPTSLSTSELQTANQWDNGASATFDIAGTKLAAVTFEKDNLPDGAGDGAMTIAEVATAIKDYYIAHSNTLPADGSSFRVEVDATHFTDVVVRRKS